MLVSLPSHKRNARTFHFVFKRELTGQSKPSYDVTHRKHTRFLCAFCSPLPARLLHTRFSAQLRSAPTRSALICGRSYLRINDCNSPDARVASAMDKHNSVCSTKRPKINTPNARSVCVSVRIKHIATRWSAPKRLHIEIHREARAV
jgi:hypothetical protein